MAALRRSGILLWKCTEKFSFCILMYLASDWQYNLFHVPPLISSFWILPLLTAALLCIISPSFEAFFDIHWTVASVCACFSVCRMYGRKAGLSMEYLFVLGHNMVGRGQGIFEWESL